MDVLHSSVMSSTVVVITPSHTSPHSSTTQQEGVTVLRGCASTIQEAMGKLWGHIRSVVDRVPVFMTFTKWEDSIRFKTGQSAAPQQRFLHVNLKDSFSLLYGVELADLNSMVSFLRLEKRTFSEFQALDMCYNMSQVVFQMSKAGHLFFPVYHSFIPENVQPVQPTMCTRNTYKESFKSLESDTVVWVRGLPWQAKERDIEKFFAPLAIRRDGIYIVKTRNGKASGEAYIDFISEKDVEEAMKRHKQHMGHRYIEIFKASRSEMNQTSEKSHVHGGHNSDIPDHSKCVLRLRGLPYVATTEDIQDFFKAYPLDLHNIHMAKNFEGRSSGEAFVVFQSEDVATRALLALNKAKMGSRYIEIFRSSKSELISGTTSCSSHHHSRSRSEHENTPAHSCCCVRVDGLPYSVSGEDIAIFFTDSSIAPHGINFVCGDRDRPTGEAYVVFSSAEDTERALQKHQHSMLNRYVEVSRASMEELSWVLKNKRVYTQSVDTHMTGASASSPRENPHSGSSSDSYHKPFQAYPLERAPEYITSQAPCYSPPSSNHLPTSSYTPRMSDLEQYEQPVRYPTVRIRGLPLSATTRDVEYLLQGYEFLPETICIEQLPDGRLSGNCFVCFFSVDEAARAAHERNNVLLGRRYIEVTLM